jgi:hypothetical protein
VDPRCRLHQPLCWQAGIRCGPFAGRGYWICWGTHHGMLSSLSRVPDTLLLNVCPHTACALQAGPQTNQGAVYAFPLQLEPTWSPTLTASSTASYTLTGGPRSPSITAAVTPTYTVTPSTSSTATITPVQLIASGVAITNPDGRSGDQLSDGCGTGYAALAASADGTYLVAGACARIITLIQFPQPSDEYEIGVGEETSYVQIGSVYVWHLDSNGTWELQATLLPPDLLSEGPTNLGNAVAISANGDRVAAGNVLYMVSRDNLSDARSLIINRNTRLWRRM